MAEALATIVGVGITIIFFFYLSREFREQDPILQVLGLCSLLFGVLLILVIPNVLFVQNNICEVVVTNSTLAGNSSLYQYTHYCYEDANRLPPAYYTVVLWFFRIFVIILMLRLAWSVIQMLLSMGGKRSR